MESLAQTARRLEALGAARYDFAPPEKGVLHLRNAAAGR